MKSVLLHINRDSGQKSRLQAALDLVRAQEGHLTCVQVTPIQQYVAMDPFGGSFVLPANLEELRAEEGLFREQTEERLAREGVDRKSQPSELHPLMHITNAVFLL